MRKLWFCAVAGLLVLGMAVAAMAASDKGSKAEAKAMVDKAIAYYKANGKEKAFAEFSNTKGKFVDRDLYLFVYDFNGTVLAHGANSKLIGKNLLDMQDADGKYVIKGLIDTVKKGGGWFEYKWSHPQTKKIDDKAAYVQKADDNVWIGCGVYR